MNSSQWILLFALTLGGSAASWASPPPILAGSRLTTADGHSLYTYDGDTRPGRSSCVGSCAAVWPPYLASAGAAGKPGFTLIARKNGSQQWVHDGKPLYAYAGESSAASTDGDGVNGTWHIAH